MHICAFFDSLDERYEVIVPYMQEGLANNERVLNIVERSAHDEHCSCLSKGGIDVETNLAGDLLQIVATEDTYLQGGSFAADKMYGLVEEALIAARNDGHNSLRACGDMTWALKNLPGTDELMEYEAKLNQLTPRYSCSLVCMYDVNRLSAIAMVDVLATHPYVILNGKIHANPHYIDPMELLPTLQKRPRRALKIEG